MSLLSFIKGEDVLERSSELIHSGDVIKTSNGSSQDRVLFLFDHQLVYCKKVIVNLRETQEKSNDLCMGMIQLFFSTSYLLYSLPPPLQEERRVANNHFCRQPISFRTLSSIAYIWGAGLAQW